MWKKTKIRNKEKYGERNGRYRILGAGAWAIALGLVLNKNGHHVTMWTCVEKEMQMLSTEREHKTSLPGIKIPESIDITMDITEAAVHKDLVVFAVASRYTRETAAKLHGMAEKNQKFLNVSKGIEENTLMTLAEIIEEELPGTDVSVLSGPSHAEEVGRGIPTTVVVGSSSRNTAMYIQELFMNEEFRVYTSPDREGNGAWRSFEKCNRPCGRNCGWCRLWR